MTAVEKIIDAARKVLAMRVHGALPDNLETRSALQILAISVQHWEADHDHEKGFIEAANAALDKF